MPKKRKQEGGDIPEWVVTYGDLMSLLLCFFILLAAFSELKQPREFRKILESIQEALGIEGGMGQAQIPESATNATISLLPEQAKRGENALFINQQNENNVVGRHDRVQIVHEGNYHTIGTTLSFEGGDALLTPEHRRVLLEQVAPRIRDRQNIVRVVGHAWGREDEVAGLGSGIGDGLDAMAFRRAMAVRDFLTREAGVNGQILRVVSAADTEPAELPTFQGQSQARNRRVQIYMIDRTLGQVHPDPLGTGRVSAPVGGGGP
ncbi:MAG: flagellar motor protein MotB [Planctomycetota bacterium]